MNIQTSVHGQRKRGHQVLCLVYPVDAYAALPRRLFYGKKLNCDAAATLPRLLGSTERTRVLLVCSNKESCSAVVIRPGSARITLLEVTRP